jgi:pyruvate ferredoxin oxidoreductase alpha subunit
MSTAIGSAAAGARVMSATSANGLALMFEMLYIAAGGRFPMVLSVVNRALSAPLNIHCDHSDSMGARDSGWIQFYAESGQEAYDNTIQAVRIAEHPSILTPVMSCQDGFITGHGVERVGILPDEAVAAFVGPYNANMSLLDVAHPITVGAWDFTDYYFEHKRQQLEAMENCMPIIESICQEYATLSGRPQPLVETYAMEDAECAIVVLSSSAGTTRTVVKALRAQGIKAGLVKPHLYRPFPADQIVAAIGHCKAVAVLDRACSPGAAQGMGPLGTDIASALYANKRCDLKVINYIYGLGGRDLVPPMVESVYTDLAAVAAGDLGARLRYLGVRN